MVHKKINLADDMLAWEHERFGIRRLPAFTLSHLSSHRLAQRSSIMDVRSVSPSSRHGVVEPPAGWVHYWKTDNLQKTVVSIKAVFIPPSTPLCFFTYVRLCFVILTPPVVSLEWCRGQISTNLSFFMSFIIQGCQRFETFLLSHTNPIFPLTTLLLLSPSSTHLPVC